MARTAVAEHSCFLASSSTEHNDWTARMPRIGVMCNTCHVHWSARALFPASQIVVCSWWIAGSRRQCPLEGLPWNIYHPMACSNRSLPYVTARAPISLPVVKPTPIFFGFFPPVTPISRKSCLPRQKWSFLRDQLPHCVGDVPGHVLHVRVEIIARVQLQYCQVKAQLTSDSRVVQYWSII